MSVSRRADYPRGVFERWRLPDSLSVVLVAGCTVGREQRLAGIAVGNAGAANRGHAADQQHGGHIEQSRPEKGSPRRIVPWRRYRRR